MESALGIDTKSSLWNAEMAKEHCNIFGYTRGYLCLDNNCWRYTPYAPDDRDYYDVKTGLLHVKEIPVIVEHEQGFTTKKKKQMYNQSYEYIDAIAD